MNLTASEAELYARARHERPGYTVFADCCREEVAAVERGGRRRATARGDKHERQEGERPAGTHLSQTRAAGARFPFLTAGAGGLILGW